MGLFESIRRVFARPAPKTGAPAAPVREEPKTEAPAAPVREKPAPVPFKRQWAGDMVPRATGPGESVEHSGGGYICCRTVRLEWVSRETDPAGDPLRTRRPESRVTAMPYRDFTAAGKHYSAPHQLVSEWESTYSRWAMDIYGRSVLMVTERFPCFDSSDYLYEDRCFRWFLLCENGKLTSVYYTDGTTTVTVTEDVLDLEEKCWKGLQEEKCFDDDDA